MLQRLNEFRRLKESWTEFVSDPLETNFIKLHRLRKAYFSNFKIVQIVKDFLTALFCKVFFYV